MGRIDDLRETLRAVKHQQQQVAELERELMRLSPQVAALEERIEQLRAEVEAPAYQADADEQAAARSLVEEVRAEHARVRARISAATVFEERLRVIEERLGIDSLTGRPAEPTGD